MQTVSFKEYEDAKLEILSGVEYHEDTNSLNQYGMMSKTYSTAANGNFWEVTDPNRPGIIEFWSTKHPNSRYYDGRTCKEIIVQKKKKIAIIEQEHETHVKSLEAQITDYLVEKTHLELEASAYKRQFRGFLDEMAALLDNAIMKLAPGNKPHQDLADKMATLLDKRNAN
jgi:hypothetical protein